MNEVSKSLGRARLAEQAARLLRSHVAGENVDDLMHHWADEWDALTGESYTDDVSDHDCKPGCNECDAWTFKGNVIGHSWSGELGAVLFGTNKGKPNE